jgi:hypothetical protein
MTKQPERFGTEGETVWQVPFSPEEHPRAHRNTLRKSRL